MRIAWSLPVPGETPDSSRGDVVRATRLVAALRALGHDVTLVAACETPGAAAGVAAHRGILRRLLPPRAARALRDLGRSAFARRHARRVARIAIAEHAELIIETQVHGIDSGHRAARRAGLPLVLDDCSPASEEEELGSGLPALVRRGLAKQAAAAALLVTVTEEARDRLVAGGAPAGRLRVVPNGVDLAEHERARARRTELRAAWCLVEDAVVAVFAGSFQPWHRADLLVEAAGLVADPRLVVVLVGDGPLRAEAERRIAELGIGGRVRLLGAVAPARVAEILAACDVGVLPDSNEHGHPMKLVEYAAAGLAIVAADVGPVRALLRHERTGLLVPRADAQALARALERLVGDPALRHRLGEAAGSGIAEASDWRRLAAGLVP